jgi:hypothetical protein
MFMDMWYAEKSRKGAVSNFPAAINPFGPPPGPTEN